MLSIISQLSQSLKSFLWIMTEFIKISIPLRPVLLINKPGNKICDLFRHQRSHFQKNNKDEA